MHELIKVTYEGERQTVSGRDLHIALEVTTPYHIWFPRMCEYGFAEGESYCTILFDRSDGLPGKPQTDHMLTIEMAKEIAMLQRTDKGKQVRQYFIELEKAWNTPEMVMGRALRIADDSINRLKSEKLALTETVTIQTQQIAELQPKASYYDLVLQTKGVVAVTVISKEYGMSAVKFNDLLHEYGVQYKVGDTWILYQKYAEMGYTSTRTTNYVNSKQEPCSAVHTYWTQKGRLFLYDTLKANGLLPIIERGGIQ